ncbi:MAG TPA: alpha/beta fold hydrolase, partial [Pseudomonadales bacterium]|nr:alpha/beta fold hydrolase [Pseudomonadales bacterium]
MSSFRSVIRAAMVSALFVATATRAAVYENEYWSHDTDVRVKSFDGTVLKANVFIPNEIKEGEKRPTVVFINSWVLNDGEYIPEAKNLANMGYIVFSYATRGFGQSTGIIDTNGPNDFKDVQKVLDYIIANYPVDPMHIGFAGVSYGSGISLNAIAREPRIKTVVAMSTWGDLVASLFPGETPNHTWLTLLVNSGKLTGYLDSIVSEYWNNMNTYSNVPETLAWGKARSPIAYMNQLNARLNDPDPTHPKPSIFISNSLADYLFRPNSAFEYFRQFQGEKRIQLNPGIHGSNLGNTPTAAIALTQEWQRVYEWFDYQLKGINTRIMDRAPVNLQVKFVGREEYDAWPLPDSIQENYRFNLLPRDETEGADKTGGLSPDPTQSDAMNTITAGADSGASMGTPIAAEFKEQHFGNPITLDTKSFDHNHGLWLTAQTQT